MVIFNDLMRMLIKVIINFTVVEIIFPCSVEVAQDPAAHHVTEGAPDHPGALPHHVVQDRHLTGAHRVIDGVDPLVQ